MTIQDIDEGDTINLDHPPTCCGRVMDFIEGYPGEPDLLECALTGDSQIYILNGRVSEPPAFRCEP